MNEHHSRNVLRVAALTALLVGGAGSLAFMFRVGHRNNSLLLLLLFTGWVISPFVAFVFIDAASKQWPLPARKTLYILMLVLALASLVLYGGVALGPPKSKPAFMFLIVPLASWIVIAISTIRIAGRQRKR